MSRTRTILLGWFIVALAFPQRIWAVTTTEGTDGTQGTHGTPSIDKSTSKIFCSQAARGAIVNLPGGSVITLNACSTSTIVSTDIGSTAPGAGLIPVAGTNSKIDVGFIPTLSTFSATNAMKVDVLNGLVTATHTTIASDVGAISTSTLNGTNVTVDIANGSITATHSNTGTGTGVTGTFQHVPMWNSGGTSLTDTPMTYDGANMQAPNQFVCKNGMQCEGVTAVGTGTGTGTTTNAFSGVRPLAASSAAISPVYGSSSNTVMEGNDRGWALPSSATYSDVGADAAGAATSAVNTAVYGNAGYVPYFTGAHTIGNLAPYANSPATYSVPVSQGAPNLNAWITLSRITATYFGNNTVDRSAGAGACITIASVSVTSTTTASTFLIHGTINGDSDYYSTLICKMAITYDSNVAIAGGYATGQSTGTIPYTMHADATATLSAGSHTIYMALCNLDSGGATHCRSNAATSVYNAGTLLVEQFGY